MNKKDWNREHKYTEERKPNPPYSNGTTWYCPICHTEHNTYADANQCCNEEK